MTFTSNIVQMIKLLSGASWHSSLLISQPKTFLDSITMVSKVVNSKKLRHEGIMSFGDDGIINTANKALKVRYSTGSASYEGRLRWSGLQLGNNGTNRIVAGNTAAGT